MLRTIGWLAFAGQGVALLAISQRQQQQKKATGWSGVSGPPRGGADR